MLVPQMLARVTFPLAAANCMNQAARMVMAIVGPVLAVELGLSAIELGVLAACLFAAYAAAQLPLGVALDAFGARRVQTVLMLLAAIGFATFALSPGFAGLVAARIVLGVGISAGLMALIKAHADWFERGRVAYVTSIATAIGALGSALTTSPVQAMLPALGWRGVFWVLCVLALGVAAWIFLSVPDKPPCPWAARPAGRRGRGANPAWRHCLERSHSRLADLLAARPGGCDTVDVQLCLPRPLQAPGCATWPTWTDRRGPACCSSIPSRWSRAVCSPAAPPAGTRGRLAVFFRSDRLALQAWCCCRPASCCSRANPRSCSCSGLRSLCWCGGTRGLCRDVPDVSARADRAGVEGVNTLTLGGAFLVQAAMGWILDLWPRTAADGWDPDGYSWALALTVALQALAALVMATAQRHGHGRFP